MGNKYTYEPTNLIKDQNGIVVSVQFSVTVTDDNNGNLLTVNSQTALPAPSSDVIPYEQLSKEDVVGWIKKLVGQQTEELADSEFAAYIERKTQQLSSGTPW